MIIIFMIFKSLMVHTILGTKPTTSITANGSPSPVRGPFQDKQEHSLVEVEEILYKQLGRTFQRIAKRRATQFGGMCGAVRPQRVNVPSGITTSLELKIKPQMCRVLSKIRTPSGGGGPGGAALDICLSVGKAEACEWRLCGFQSNDVS